jgi:hypothetical protein
MSIEITDRQHLLHCARVYLAEARRRRSNQRGFSFALLAFAASARRQAMALNVVPAQGELFA